MLTYLELCRSFTAEHGIAGGTGPASVVGNVGELANVCRWIAESVMYIESLWLDWDFLWYEYSQTLTVGDVNPPIVPSAVGAPSEWRKKRFILDRTEPTFYVLDYVEWPEFRGVHDVGTIVTSRPQMITVLPNNTLRLNYKPDYGYQLDAECWLEPQLLVNDADVMKIPTRFYRLVLARASIMYGNREDAPEIIAGAEAEYMDLLDKMEAAKLPKHRQMRMGQDVEDLTVQIPG